MWARTFIEYEQIITQRGGFVHGFTAQSGHDIGRNECRIPIAETSGLDVLSLLHSDRRHQQSTGDAAGRAAFSQAVRAFGKYF